MEGPGMPSSPAAPPTFGAIIRRLSRGLKHSSLSDTDLVADTIDAVSDADPVPDTIDAFHFQRRAAEILEDLLVLPADNPAADILSLAWMRRLLDAFILCLREFRALLLVGSGNGGSPAERPPLDRLVVDFFDGAVKVLDICNAVSDGLDLVQRWHKRLSIAAAVLTRPDHATLLGRIRRARKRLADLTVLTLDDSDGGGGLVGQSNRYLGRAKATKEESLPHKALSWSVSRPWSAARQLEAIGGGLQVPSVLDVAATGGLASAVYTMGAVLFSVSFALVAAIPCQGRGLPAYFSVPTNFLISGPVTALCDRILEESKKEERRNSCGLLKEIHQIELCSRHFIEITEAAEFPLPEDKEAEVQGAALHLVQLCEYIKDELSPLQGRIREMFHQIVRTRSEILDGSNLNYRLQVSDTVHRPIGVETLVNKGMPTGGNSPVTVTKLLDKGHSKDISPAPSQQQRLMTSAQLPSPRSSSLSAWQRDRAARASKPRPHHEPNRPQHEPGIKATHSMMPLPDRGPQARVPTKHPLSVAEGPQESSTEGMTDASQGTLEAPVSSSLGAMGSLLKKLSLLLAPNYPLRRSLKHAIKLLEEDLEEIRDALMEQSIVDCNKNKVKYWMEEVRELLYDIEDFVDMMMFSHTAAYAKSRSIHGHSQVFSQTRRRAAELYIKNKSHRQRVARLRIHRLPNILKLSTRVTKVSELRTLLWEASERHERYQLDGCISNPTFLSYIRSSRIPVSYKVVHNLIGIEDPKKELTMWLTNQSEQQLKVLCIVGPLGVGKTTLAKELYRELSGQFECWAFIRVSRNPDIGRLLQELFSQIQQPKQSCDVCSLQGIIDKISNHLQDKRYFIVIDDLCEAEAWDLMKNAFPKSNKCSRIIVTGEVQNVGAECSGYHAVDIFELKPLGSQDSENLFLGRAFSSEDQCPDLLKDVSCRMSKECGGLPLAIITLAGLFASLRNNSDIWHQLQRYVATSLTNLSLECMIKEIVNLCCDNLPQDLKTCLQYLTIYPEGCTIWKVDLLKQWTAECFITSTIGNEGVAESYFDELVKRGIIQPEKITHNNEVLSCTVHHIVLDLIVNKSREQNFITVVDYSQTNALFFMKPRRLSLHFSCAQYATKPEDIRLSQVRSLAFFGLPRCMPSVIQFKVLRVLIIEFWGNKDGFSIIDLSKICRLVLLRYLKISGHIFVEFPSNIQALKLLETLEIFARVSTTLNEKAMEIDAKESALPNDIVHLPGLLHLSLQEGIKLPDRIGLLTSLQTLKHYDLGNNSEDCTHSLGELKNLRDLHLTCSTALSREHLKRNLIALASSLGKLTNLESLTLAHGAVGMTMFVEHSSAMFTTSKFLQRLEVLQSTCAFSSLPGWIGKLCRLSILKIVVRVLISSDIDVLTGLPGLTVLSLYVRQPSIERVIFHHGALPVLKYFKYSCSALCIDFQEAALPNLHRLKLCFNVHRGERYSHTICSIKHLSNLKGIALRIGAAAGVEESDRRAAESAFLSSIHKHPRFPIYMNIRRVDCVGVDE